ncbi:protein phosphatase 1H-like isoform X2 [Branchiostoma floridae x Branchiostoma belcheri]
MISRVRNVVNSVMGGLAALPQPPERPQPDDLELKYPYCRPEFLQLSQDEIQVSADHVSRPIMVPREPNRLPWSAGYAEVINAGKSPRNEDQAATAQLCISRPARTPNRNTNKANNKGNNGNSGEDNPHQDTMAEEEEDVEELHFTYFGVFDGHAGTGAAIMASRTLHYHIRDKMTDVSELLLPVTYEGMEQNHPGAGSKNGSGSGKPSSRVITKEHLIIGALERSFCEMDSQIERERLTFRITGGCTALVAVFVLGKLFLVNAGDSRAVLCRNGEAIPMSRDFTPESERQRLQYLAHLHPHLLYNEFTALEFPRRLHKTDLGKQTLYRDHTMTGWAPKTVTEDDLKFPLIFGEGKRCRVLATIGVTRGFGDHDLRVYDSHCLIKPFLTAAPEIQTYDMLEQRFGEDDFLIMASDGLWDVVANQDACNVVLDALTQFHPQDPNRYTSAAQELVMHARGTLQGKGWRRPAEDKPASGDDITAFIIPLYHYGNQHLSSPIVLSESEESSTREMETETEAEADPGPDSLDP